MTKTGPEILPAVEPYRLHQVSLDAADASLLLDWKTLLSNCQSHSLMDDPEWLQGYFAGQLDKLTAYLLYQSGYLSGVAPFLRKDFPLKWYLGELTVARPQLRRLRLLGGIPNLPEDEAVYDLLFSEL